MTLDNSTIPMFGIDNNRWQDEWDGMPEYNNSEYPEPAVTVTFKFLTGKDYHEFYDIIKKYLYGGQKPFDGRQEINSKTAWYPHKEKASRYIYADE